jgi:hypothetical protein
VRHVWCVEYLRLRGRRIEHGMHAEWRIQCEYAVKGEYRGAQR